MPRIVAIAGYTGLAFWLFTLAASGHMIWMPTPDGSSPTDVETDRIALPCLVIISALGAGSATGMLRRNAKAYQGFVLLIGLTALFSGLIAAGSPQSWMRWAWATGICGVLLIARSMLVAESVREHFGLPPIHRNHLVAPGWWNLGLGILAIASAWWALPAPMFGQWLERQHVIALTIVLGASNAVLGWGLLTGRKWVRSLTIALGLTSVLYETGVAWNPNPLGRLGAAEVMTHQSVLTSTIFSVAFSSWTFWRIRLQERERRHTPFSDQIS